MWKNLPLKPAVYASVTLNLAAITLILVVNQNLPPVLPLLYGLPSGPDQLIPKAGLLIAPISGLIITFLNIVLASLTKDDFFKKIFVITGTFVSLLTTIATIKTVSLVGFF